jgi:hypothetical protein
VTAEIFEIVRDSIPLFFDLLPGVTTTAQKFSAMLLQRVTLRFADDLDGTNSSILEWNKDPMASARHIQPVRFFTLQSTKKEEDRESSSTY